MLWGRSQGCKSGSLLLRSLKVERINRASPNTRGPVLKGGSMRKAENQWAEGALERLTTSGQNQHEEG